VNVGAIQERRHSEPDRCIGISGYLPFFIVTASSR